MPQSLLTKSKGAPCDENASTNGSLERTSGVGLVSSPRTPAAVRCAAAGGFKPLACYHPVDGWRLPSGKLTLNRSLAGGPSAWAMTIPCGGCIGCKSERARQWSVRLMHENTLHEKSSYLTLTYNDASLPSPPSLNKKHFPEFIKRSRERFGKLRYFHCGEYGELNGRPHYHAIIFGYDWSKDRVFHKKSKDGHNLYTSKLLDETWGHGFCYIGAVTKESAGYCARYILKKITGADAEQHYEHIDPRTGEVSDLQPEYTTMSLKPGIGLKWYEKWRSDVYPSDEVVINGKRTKPPKYYDTQRDKTHPFEMAHIKSRRKAAALKRKHDNTPDRLRVREEVKERTMKHFIREP